jgi:hypothetical protein
VIIEIIVSYNEVRIKKTTTRVKASDESRSAQIAEPGTDT